MAILGGLSGQPIDRSCEYELFGTVLDRSTGKPLPYANIYIPALKTGEVADAQGEFRISELCRDTVMVRVSHVGCAPRNMRLIASNSPVSIELEHSDVGLDEVDISAESRQSRMQLSKTEVEPAEIQVKSGQGVGELAELLPGVSSLRTGNSIVKPVIHGLHSNRLVILNNGIPQGGQLWGREHAPEIDAQMAGRVELFRGADALRYSASGLGGVLLYAPSELPRTPGIEGEARLSGYSNNRQGNAAVMLEGKVSDRLPISWRVQGSLKKAGNSRTPDYWLANTGSEEYNFSYGLGYLGDRWEAEMFYSQFNQTIGIYSNSHIGNLTDLVSILRNEVRFDTASFSYDIQRPYQRVEHELAKGRVAYRTGKGKLELVVARQYNRRREFDKDRGYGEASERDIAQLDYELTTYTGDLSYSHPELFDGLIGEAGVQVLSKANTFSGRNFMPNYRGRRYGGYITETYQKDDWKAKAGLRYDVHSFEVFGQGDGRQDLSYNGVAAALGASRDIGRGWKVTAGAKRLWRNPAINELYSDGLHHGAAAIEQGDPGLERELMYGLNLRADYVHDGIKAMVQIYSNWINDYIYLEPQDLELTIRGAFPEYGYNQTNALFQGIDGQLELPLGSGLQLDFRGFLLWARNLDGGELPYIPAHQGSVFVRKSFTGTDLLKDPYMELGVRATAERSNAPVNITPFIGDGSNFPDELPESFDFAAPPPAYGLVDAEVGTRLVLGDLSMNLAVRVENILNEKYRNYMNRFRYFAAESGRNIMIRLRVPFKIRTQKTKP